jgi:hypothetical protein
MGFLMAPSGESNQILGSVIAQAAPGLDVMNLKTLDASTRLATPAIWVQDFQVELTISFRIKPQSWLFGTHPRQSVTWTSSSNCFLSGFGRPITSRVREGSKAFRFPVSRLTPARKSAQIISKQ